jgi:hypothetical protein
MAEDAARAHAHVAVMPPAVDPTLTSWDCGKYACDHRSRTGWLAMGVSDAATCLEEMCASDTLRWPAHGKGKCRSGSWVLDGADDSDAAGRCSGGWQS